MLSFFTNVLAVSGSGRWLSKCGLRSNAHNIYSSKKRLKADKIPIKTQFLIKRTYFVHFLSHWLPTNHFLLWPSQGLRLSHGSFQENKGAASFGSESNRHTTVESISNCAKKCQNTKATLALYHYKCVRICHCGGIAHNAVMKPEVK